MIQTVAGGSSASAAENVVHVMRSGQVESVHRVHAAVVDWQGRTVATLGNPETVTFYRSCAKPLQALPLIEDGAAEEYGLTPEELAVCCASHNSDHRHIQAVQSILKKCGRGASDLECGPHVPMHPPNAEALLRAGVQPEPIHNNCSGKHAGMIALATHHGWPVEGYLKPEHPVQQRMSLEVARWADLPVGEIPTAVDGCGVVTYGLSLRAMARSFAAFTANARDGGPAQRVVRAMTECPFMVAGEDRLCTKLMFVAGDRAFAKTGAEGLYCAGVLDGALGVALKVEDGARRASNVALVAILQQLGVLSTDQVDELEAFGRPPIKNTLEETVGHLEAGFTLRLADSSSADAEDRD